MIALGRRFHIEEHHTLRLGANEIHEPFGIRSPLPHRAFLSDGIAAMRRRNQRRSIRRDQPALDRATRFRQLRRNDAVNIARDRHQRQDGRTSRLLGSSTREELQVIDRRAGTLRYARNRSRLGDVVFCFGDFNEPVGENTATLST